MITETRSVLIAFEAFDRLVNRGRSIQVQHREAYKALVVAVEELRAAAAIRVLDAEAAPEYVTMPGDVSS